MSFWRKTTKRDVPPPIERRPKIVTEQAPATPSPVSEEAPSTPTTASAAVSVLGPEVRVEGNLSGRGTVRVEGAFHGEVRLDGTLIVAQSGRVQGDTLVARRIIVEGLVQGPVLAEYVEIRATGRVWGDVTTTAFVTHEGAFLRGRVRMEDDVTLPLTTETRPSDSPSPETTPPETPPTGETAADEAPV